MTRIAPRRAAIAAAILTGTAALGAALPAPALANGSVSFEIRPGNEDERRAMQIGLGLYAIVQGARGSAHAHQSGHGNAAGIVQRGQGGFGVVHQDGNGHTGTLTQNGHGQNYGIFQFGEGTTSHVTQTGHGDTGILLQFGW